MWEKQFVISFERDKKVNNIIDTLCSIAKRNISFQEHSIET